jgi:GAF domain-containing protein
MPTLDLLQDEIIREERYVGIRPGQPVSLAAIRQRRRQLEVLALFVFFALVLTTLRAQVWHTGHDGLINPDYLRAAMITCAGGFIAYALEKEKHLRKLTLLDLEARRTNLFVADAILRAAALSDDLELIHATLVLDEVVDRVAARAQKRLDAGESAVRLLVAGGELPVAGARLGAAGPVTAAGRSALAEQVALSRVPRRREGEGDEPDVIAAPLVHYGRLLGVIEAVAAPGSRFDKVDLAVLTALAERAAIAIGHARAYSELRERVELADGSV